MSRLEQGPETNLVSNPAKRFLEYKNFFNQEEVTIKGKKKEIKVFEKAGFEWSEKTTEDGEDVWTKYTLDIPVKFAVLNGDWVNFKGWDETEKVKYWSNEVNNSKDTITVRSKDGIAYEFTLNQLWGKVEDSKVKDEKLSKKIKGDLKAMGVKQYSSIYAAMKDESDEFELINFQLRGANLSGNKELNKEGTPSGWWNVSKEFKKGKRIYTNYLEINDWIVEDGELGEYGILNITLGDVISKEDNEELEVLYNKYMEYQKYYTEKNAVKAEKEAEPAAKEAEAVSDDLPF